MLRLRELRLMPAAQAVFDTYELLESIVVLLPPTDVNNCRRVAKAWDQLVLQSKQILRARALAPVPIPDHDPPAHDLASVDHRVYLLSQAPQTPHYDDRLGILLCVVRVEGGIRVKDLLDAQDKLNRTTARYSDTAFDEKNSPRLMVMFAMVGSQMSQRHLRSWDHNFGYDYEETQSEIDGQNDELDLLDSGAESEYFKHCAEKRGLDPDDDDENWSLYFEHLRRHASVDLPETVEGAAWSENEGMFTAEALHEMSSDDVNESCSGSDTDLDSDNGGAMAVESAEDDMTQYEGRAVLETIIERTDNHDCDADEDDEDDYNGEGGYESMGAPG